MGTIFMFIETLKLVLNHGGVFFEVWPWGFPPKHQQLIKKNYTAYHLGLSSNVEKKH